MPTGRIFKPVLAGATFQIGLVAAVALVTALPPARGVMLVLPAWPGNPAASIGWVLPAGGALVAPGPYAGALIVMGDRSALLPAALSHGAILVAASFAGCGNFPKEDQWPKS